MKSSKQSIHYFADVMDQKTKESIARIVAKSQQRKKEKKIDCKNYFSTIARINNAYQEI